MPVSTFSAKFIFKSVPISPVWFPFFISCLAFVFANLFPLWTESLVA
jgi:hypothetical protein